MLEGWHGDDYLILFDESEISLATDRYAILQSLPGFKLLGLRSWDDFIVENTTGQTYSVPTVPLDSELLSPFSGPQEKTILSADKRFTGKIKWYVKPIVFGGNPEIGENVAWVSHEEHAKLVKWWNDKYRSLKNRSGGR
jgi:hypothetical protein